MAARAHAFLPIDLNQVMAYQHPNLVIRLQDKLNVSQPQAVELFDDLKRFLYLCATHKERLGPTDSIDEAWHNFILFTRDYRVFCNRFLGKFVEHVPLTPQQRSVKDGSTKRTTSMIARQVFGDTLSANWRYGTSQGGSCVSDCSRCSGSTNCHS